MIGVVYRTRIRSIVVAVGWRDAIGGPFVCVVAGWVLTYCSALAVMLEWRASFGWAYFLGPWSRVCHGGGMAGAQRAFRLCSKTVRTVRFGVLKPPMESMPYTPVWLDSAGKRRPIWSSHRAGDQPPAQ
nr:MAG TPA: hypothetical protein [Caudoviricetes sp.]